MCVILNNIYKNIFFKECALDIDFIVVLHLSIAQFSLKSTTKKKLYLPFKTTTYFSQESFS